MKKPVKKTKKAPIKKVLAVKKAPKKKVVTKKAVISKNKPILRKKLVFKKKKSLKPLGIFVAIGGALSMVAITSVVFANLNQVASTDSNVLGWFSGASGSISRPTYLKSSTYNASVSLSWKSAANATGYKIYRKSGLFGKVSNIGSVYASAVYYSDTTVTPGKAYYYAVSSLRGKSESAKTSFVRQVASKPIITVPKVTITNLNNSSTYLNLEMNTPLGSTRNGFYVYCDNCDKKIIDVAINGKSSDKNVYYEEGGVGVLADGTGSFAVNIKKLDANKKYSFQVSQYRIYNGKRYSGAKTSPISVTMPAVGLAPAEPAGFAYNGGIVGGGLSFIWYIPTETVDGYDMSISCYADGQVYTGGWTGSPVPSRIQVSQDARTGINTQADEYYGFDLADFGAGKGKCTARLVAFNIVNGEKKYSSGSFAEFDNGLLGTPISLTGFTLGDVIPSINSGKSAAFFTWDTPANAVVGYLITIQCYDNTGFAWSREITASSAWLNAQGQTVFDTGDVLEQGHTSCTAFISPYNVNTNGDKVFGDSASAVKIFNI